MKQKMLEKVIKDSNINRYSLFFSIYFNRRGNELINGNHIRSSEVIESLATGLMKKKINTETTIAYLRNEM